MDPTALLWLGIAGAVLAVLVLLVVWTSAAKRGHEKAGAAVFARSPVLMIVFGVVLVGCASLPAFGTITSDGAWELGLIAFVALVLGAVFASYALVFWVADDVGLTRQVLSFKKTLTWQEIDWIYGAVKITRNRVYGIIPAGQSRQADLIIEAGPKRRIQVQLSAGILFGGNPGELVRAIREKATHALFGYDKRAAVLQRRTTSALSSLT